MISHGEYLRRKKESLPVILGPARPGDASETTRIRGAIAAAANAAAERRIRTAPPSRICCGPRVRAGAAYYESTPIRIGPGCGLSEDRSHGRLIQIAAGCALIASGACSRQPTEIRQPCCPQESTPEIPRDATGKPTDPTRKAEAYKGRQTCCPIQGPPLQDLDPATLNHCCRLPGYGDTATMTNVPLGELPIVPAERAGCCSAPAPTGVAGYCDGNGYPL
jgi:hypothetical protein